MRIITIISFVFISFFANAQSWGTSWGGYTEDCCCCPVDGLWTLYNVGGATSARVSSYEDNNKILLNGVEIARLDAQEVFELNLSTGDSLQSCFPISASGEDASAHIEIQPRYTSSTEFGTNSSRLNTDLNIYSFTATSAQIFRNGALFATIPVVPGQVTIWTNTGNVKYHVLLNGEGMVYRRQGSQGNGDPTIIFKPSNEIIGWHSTAAYVSSVTNAGLFQFYPMDGNPYASNTGTTYNVVNFSDTGLPGGSASDDYYDARVGAIVTGVDLFAASRADSDGGDNTAFLPTDLMRTHHLIPQPTEFVSFTSNVAATITVYDLTGTAINTFTLTKNSSVPQAPFAARFGTPNGSANHPAGYLYISDNPVHVVYQPKGAGTFGSDDDETISLGYNL